MDFEDSLGHFRTLSIRRFGSPGAFLADPDDERPDAPCLLLLGSEIPLGAEVGQQLDVFVYRDSEGRPLATTQVPKLSLGEVAFLRVTACEGVGAFVDWGLPKELLVPFAEQTTELHVGVRQPIGLYIDKTGRLAGTMRISELLDLEEHDFQEEHWVNGEAWRNDPEIGLFVIVERRFVGLVPCVEPHGLSRGEAAKFRITHVLPDGKLELSLRGHAHEELASDADKVLAVLRRPGAPKVGDRSDPEELRALFGLSKKAFKRAVGRLLKEQLVVLDERGQLVVK